jgi:hypothetical protein
MEAAHPRPRPAAERASPHRAGKCVQPLLPPTRSATNAGPLLLPLAAALPSTTPYLLNAPRSIEAACGRPDADEWRRVHDAEPRRHEAELVTWTYEDLLPTEKLFTSTMGYKTKTNTYGGLESRKTRCAIRGDRMRPDVDFDEMRTAFHMPSQSGRRFMLAVAATESAAVQSWDIPGVYMRALADPRYRVTTQQPLNFDGTLAAPGKVCVIRRAMPGAPDANSLWEHFRDYRLKSWGWI